MSFYDYKNECSDLSKSFEAVKKNEECEECGRLETCLKKEEIVKDYVDAILNNKVTINGALESLFDFVYDLAYRDFIQDEIIEKSNYLECFEDIQTKIEAHEDKYNNYNYGDY